MPCPIDRRPFLPLLLILAIPTLAGARSADGPLSPDDERMTFQLQPGLRVDLVAAEPMVVSPVAIAFDPRGRLFVAENRGYPTGPAPGEPPAGRIAMLEDTDGDGRMDRRVEFADNLTYPNGLLPWDGGLIVTCAPDVLWLKDDNGDGQADTRKVLFTGFSTQGSTQLRVSHPTVSPDGWIYLTSGLTGGSVTCPTHPDRPPVTLGRTDFRFRPDLSDYGPADGGAQFGQTFDDAGHRFICYNRVQVQHVVIASSVLHRNPRLAFSQTVQDCPADLTPEPLKGHGVAARLYPISKNVTTADSHAGTFTAACAVFAYRGGSLPDRYRGAIFSCDPTGNLVHADRLETQGASFSAQPIGPGTEFLASSDNWCRPVFLTSGPDGALYFCDMYRKTIEHPEYLPVEVRKRTDFDSGKTMGRIWRVTADVANAQTVPPDRESGPVSGLTSSVGWRQDAAHRRLLHDHDPSTAAPLLAIATNPNAPPSSVVRALWLLDRLGKLDDATLRSASTHNDPGVRENALQLIETRLAASEQPAWLDAVLNRAQDDNPRVRFQSAITLGSVPETLANDRRIAQALAAIAVQDGDDRWTRAAVLSSRNNREAGLVDALRQRTNPTTSVSPALLVEIGRMLPSSTRTDWPKLVRLLTASDGGSTFADADRAGLLTGIAETVRGKLKGDESADTLAAIAGSDAEARQAIQAIVQAMTAIAANPDAPSVRRREAIGLLGFTAFAKSGEALLKLVDPAQPEPIRAASIRALGHQRDPKIAAELLETDRFSSYTPALRDEVLSALLSQSSHVPGVLSAVEDGQIPPGAIDPLHRRQLSQSPDPAIRDRAGQLFGAVSGDRARVYESFRDVVNLKADPEHGRAVFRRECAQCHRLDQVGATVGPDLFGIRNQPKEAILLHILVPDHEITQGFTAYTIATTDGRILTGLIASETPTSITLRQPLGQEDTIPRDAIDALSASKQSLMPTGVENTINRQELADLLAYLKGEAAVQQE